MVNAGERPSTDHRRRRVISPTSSARPANGRLFASRARRIEEKADKIAIEARGEVSRFNADQIIEKLVDRTNAIDEFEQAAFIAAAAARRG